MKKIRIVSLVSFLSLIFASHAKAVCPVCVVAVGAGLGLSRWLGIDDSISGLWFGALTASIAIWTANWLRRKGNVFKLLETVSGAAYFVLVISPLYYYGIIGVPENTLWNTDKLLLGMVLGGAVVYGMNYSYQKIKEKNDGKPYFPYQKVAMPVGLLIILSVVFYLITK